MAATFQFDLVSPEKLLLSDAVDEVVVPGSEGYLTILPRHASVMTRLKAGIVRVKKAGQVDKAFVVFDGFVDIAADHCSLLTERAIALKNSTEQELESHIEKAQTELQNAMKGDGPLSLAEDFLPGLA